MIDFMVIGLPRSGTTWLANWLTTARSFCLHDPLYKVHYTAWDTDSAHLPPRSSYERIGVSCTGIWRWPEWVNQHPAKKLVIVRNVDEVNDSLANIGIDPLESNAAHLLSTIKSPRINYSDIFDIKSAPVIWNHLIGGEFDAARYKQLLEFNVTPNFKTLKTDKLLNSKLYDELYR